MSEHGEHHETPQPVLIPFLLLCTALIWFYWIGATHVINVEHFAGWGLANEQHMGNDNPLWKR